MSELPPGWAKATFEEVFNGLQYGLTASASVTADGPHFLRITDIGKGPISWSLVPRVSHQEAAERFQLQDGDFVFARSGSVGLTARVHNPPPSVFASYLIRGSPIERELADWLEVFLRSDNFLEQVRDSSAGTGMANVSASKLAAIGLPFPPLAEQRRIVAKIDAVTVRSKRARTELTHVRDLALTTKAELLLDAFDRPASGVVGEVLTGVGAGKNLRCIERPPRPGERGVVKVSAVTWGRFAPEKSKTLPIEFNPDPRSLIRDGDFLFSRANTFDLVGAVALAENTPDELYLSDKVLRLELREELKPWLLWFMRSPQGRGQLEEASSGNQLSMRNISRAALERVRLPLPPLPEQRAIVARIESAFARLDAAVAEAERAGGLLDRLEQAMVAKAFRGELVPQDPADEPASALLARLAAAPHATARRRGRKAAA